MIDAHEVVDHLKDCFNQTDEQIVLLLSQGVLLMKDCQKAMMATGVANIPGFDDNLLQEINDIDAYIADVIEEELHDRF